MTKHAWFGLLGAVTAASALAACGDDGSGVEVGSGGTTGAGATSTCVSYSEVNAQVFVPYCAQCHAGLNADGGVLLDTQQEAESRAGEIAIVVADGSMPRNAPPLSGDLVQVVQNWVDCL